MFLHIISARYIDHYNIEIQFNDGRKGIVDLSNNLKGKVFQPLQDSGLVSTF